MTTREVLQKARGLIADPAAWGQGEDRDDGTLCLLQAIDAACGGSPGWGDRFSPALARLRRHAGPVVSEFNDTHTHAEVLAVLDSAIKEEP